MELAALAWRTPRTCAHLRADRGVTAERRTAVRVARAPERIARLTAESSRPIRTLTLEPITRWLDGKSDRARDETCLESALLGGRFVGYAAHRLTGFALGRALGAATHLLESTLLLHVFADRGVIASLALKNASLLAGAFWWGALEILRSQVRADPSKAHIARRIGRWLGASLGLGVMAALAPLAVTLAAGMRYGRFSPVLDAYALACGLRLGIDIVVRTYYSGVYALQRIPRPVLSTVIGEPVGLLLVLLVWPRLGAWSFPLGLLVTVAVSRALAVHYTTRTYRMLRVPLPRPRFRLDRRSLPGRHAPRSGAASDARLDATVSRILGAGLASMSTRIGSLLVLAALLGPLLADDPPSEAIIALHLTATLLGAAGFWTQSFYPDFKRLEDDAFAVLRARFLRNLMWTGVGMGGVLWLAAAVVIRCFAHTWAVLPLIGLLAPVFLMIACLSALQLHHFARGRFLTLLVSSAPMCGAILYILFSSAGDSPPIWALSTSGSAVVAILVLWVSALVRPHASTPPTGLQPHLLQWVRALADVDGPVRVGGAKLGEVHVSHCQSFASRIADRLADRGASVAILPSHRVLFFERAPAGLTHAELVTAGVGKVQSVECTPVVANGPHAIQAAARSGLIGYASEQAEQQSAIDLLAAFRQYFGENAMAVDLASSRRGGTLPALPGNTLRAIWHDAAREARAGTSKGQHSGFEVSSFRPAGEMRVLFVVSRNEPVELRRAWKDLLGRANWTASAQVDM